MCSFPFVRAVRRRCRSDVTLGLAVSGGSLLPAAVPTAASVPDCDLLLEEPVFSERRFWIPHPGILGDICDCSTR